jgi:hypothetical protein
MTSPSPSPTPTPTPPPLILTRYLYDKPRVLVKLEQTVLQKNYPETLFWVYELYFSGFIQDVIHMAFVIYDKHCKTNYPKLKSFLQKKARELRETAQPAIIGTMYHNMITRVSGTHPTPIPPRSIYTNLSRDKIIPYMTQTAEQLQVPPYQFLKRVCKYSCMPTPPDDQETPPDDPQRIQWFRERWEYCTCMTPYWQNIFNRHQIRVDHDTRDILFDNEEMRDTFYKKYGYEPDEQPAIVQQNCLG